MASPMDAGDPMRRKKEDAEWKAGAEKRRRFRRHWRRWWWAYALRDAIIEWIQDCLTFRTVFGSVRALLALIAGVFIVIVGYRILRDADAHLHELPQQEQVLQMETLRVRN